MTVCSHPDTAPVEIRDRIDGGTTTVAHVCRTCLARLPGNWGCGDCEWVEDRTLGSWVPELVLGRPCPAHEGGDR